jgi:hypothetical protein
VEFDADFGAGVGRACGEREVCSERESGVEREFVASGAGGDAGDGGGEPGDARVVQVDCIGPHGEGG